MSDLLRTINNHLSSRVQNCELKNEDIVSVINNLGSYLNAQTISDYAKSQKITYNGALMRIGTGKIKTFELFGIKFVIDNF